MVKSLRDPTRDPWVGDRWRTRMLGLELVVSVVTDIDVRIGASTYPRGGFAERVEKWELLDSSDKTQWDGGCDG